MKMEYKSSTIATVTRYTNCQRPIGLCVVDPSGGVVLTVSSYRSIDALRRLTKVDLTLTHPAKGLRGKICVSVLSKK